MCFSRQLRLVVHLGLAPLTFEKVTHAHKGNHDMDVTNIEQIALAAAGAAITICGPVVSAFFVKHLKLQASSAQASALSNIVSAAGTLAMDELQSLAAHNPTIDIKNAAVAKAVTALQAPFTAAMAYYNLTPAHVAQMVSGELTKLLGISTNANAASAVSTALAATTPVVA